MAEDIRNAKMMPLRIFVGGLGESIVENEVSRIFESVGGVVEGVELVRTKGRSFAYVDFLPSSDKSLSKLFGTYNGCVWKGGRLRLEKAKEHYLLRLRREWAEDSAQVATVDTSELPKNLNPSEKKQLQIFFPRLRKVKSIPFSGTGKHKYSFQRVEVPSLPTHFCDCEEHSYPSQTEIKKRSRGLEEQGGGMTQEELNIMNAVMERLFEKQNSSVLTHNKTASCNNKDNSLKSIDEQHFDEDEADEDNLIINVVRKGNKREALLGSWEEPKVSENKTWATGTKKGSLEDVSGLKKQNNNQLPNKKRKTLLNDESSGNPYNISGGKKNLLIHSNNSGIVMAAQTADPESGIQLSTDHVLWSQKSSWKELVGDRGTNAFSISRIVPGLASTVEGQQRSDAPNVPNSNSKNQKLVGEEDLNSDRENQNLQSDEDLNSNSKSQNVESNEELNSDSEIQNLESDEELNSSSESQNLESDEELNSNSENQNLESDEELNSDGGNQNLESAEKLNSDGGNQNLESAEKLNSDTENQNSESDEELNSNMESDEELNCNSKNQNLESDEELCSDSENQNLESDKELNADGENQNSESDEELNSNTKNQNSESDKELNTDTKIQNMEINEELEGKLEGGDGPIEAQPTEPNVVSTQSGRGTAWRKKSSWTQLVNNTSSSFSITQLLPGINFEQQTQVEPKGKEIASSTNGKPNKRVKQDSNSVKNGSTALRIGKEVDVSVIAPQQDQRTVVAKNEPSGSVSHEKCSSAKQTSARSVEIGETCSFMRNASSLKEWAKTKAALNGSLKRKRKEK